jgi:cytochrome c peroxidase
LRAFVVAHLDPANAIANYDRTQAVLPDLPKARDWTALESAEEVAAIVAAVKQPALALSDDEVTQILSFLDSLSDPVAQKGRLGVPVRVPSGLPVDH